MTAKTGISSKIRKYLVKNNMVTGAVTMPSNIFATTGTNVSMIFLDKNKNKQSIILIDASQLGKKVKDGKNQKTVLSDEEESKIVNTFLEEKEIDDFSVIVNDDEVKERNSSLLAGQYFKVKIEYSNISEAEFNSQIKQLKTEFTKMVNDGQKLDKKISNQLGSISYENKN